MTDGTDTAQLAVFIHEVDKELSITEDLLAMCNIHCCTTGKDVFAKIRKVGELKNLGLSKLGSLATNEDLDMIDRVNVFGSVQLEEVYKDRINPLPLQFHYIIHPLNLADEVMQLNHVVLSKMLSSICRRKG